MTMAETTVLGALIFVAAVLYASVGHAGASGYLAAMALFGVAPGVMKPTALALNVLVALIATVQFARAGAFHWSLFWPFMLGSFPLAYVGGAMTVHDRVYKPIVAVSLIVAALRLSMPLTPGEPRKASLPAALLIGAVIGWVSGLVGVGGGIFLSPILILAGWANPRSAAGVAAPFILVNSLMGLLGHLSSLQSIPPQIGVWAPAAAAGGILGAVWGSRRANAIGLRRVLAVVLVVAAVKMIAV
ncbi:MAG: sulfite exporter TauE/SafE family protein [Phycisphaerales bacterium]|nr:sulfite exporter TauE/SafE family protein [Phycisphaerales bacterium]